ncbi:MAG: hypothetical protein V3W41_22120 [Planctomycetota bacterium]
MPLAFQTFERGLDHELIRPYCGLVTKDELATRRHQELLDVATRTADGVDSVKLDVAGVKKDVAELSKRFDMHEKDNEHDFKAHAASTSAQDTRITTLEEAADVSGAHQLIELKTELAATKKGAAAVAERWKGRVWSIFAALLLMAVSAGAGAYFRHIR